jgi:hypothetical protein
MLLSQPLLYRQVRGDYNEFAQTERNAAHRAVLEWITGSC